MKLPPPTLCEATDRHWAWMLAGDLAAHHDGLRLPEGGTDPPAILALLRSIAAGHREAGRCGMWLIVRDHVVVGSCGYMRPVANGAAEIGYGVSPGQRGRGLATQAVGLLIALSREAGLATLLANTAVANTASQGVLARNGFARFGIRVDPEDGELLEWRLPLAGS